MQEITINLVPPDNSILLSPTSAFDTQVETVLRDGRVFSAYLKHRNHPALNLRINQCKVVVRITEVK